MPNNRLRIWILALLFFVYLSGVIILSAITFQDPRNSQDKLKPILAYSTLKNYGYGIPAYHSAHAKLSKVHWCTNLQYFDPPRKTVALASFPGSGNTWLRYLIQQATGIYTGSVYKDLGLRKNGFPGENVVNGSVIVVKTHDWGENERKKFSKAILLVRSPDQAIQAEFNRQSGGHIGFASIMKYKRRKGQFWQNFVDEKLQTWKDMNLDWLFNFTGPTHVIFYDQLIENTEYTLRSVIDFLEFPVDENTFKCAIEHKEGIYRRRKRLLHFDPYSEANKEKIKLVQKKVYEMIYNFASPISE